MDRRKVERRLAWFSIVSAVIHFVGETWVHFKFGQFLPILIVDYIAISLLLFGGVRSLQTGNGAGLLCGAWGFTFCLNYRALFWRVAVLLKGGGTPVLETIQTNLPSTRADRWPYALCICGREPLLRLVQRSLEE